MNWDPTFDPMKALEELHANQLTLQHNQTVLQVSHNQAQDQIKALEEVVDVLIKGLDAANKANAQLMSQAVTNLNSYSLQGNH
jgi:hypothetical protein